MIDQVPVCRVDLVLSLYAGAWYCRMHPRPVWADRKAVQSKRCPVNTSGEQARVLLCLTDNVSELTDWESGETSVPVLRAFVPAVCH